MTIQTEAVRLLGIHKVYRRRGAANAAAVTNLTLTVHAGEVLGILGPSGAGKSTLLKLIGGQIRPTAGRVERTVKPLLLDEPAQVPPLAPGATVVIATRDPALALQTCTRVILLDRGRLRADRPAADLRELADPEWYRVRVKGHLSPGLSEWLYGFALAPCADGTTLLTGAVDDQAALHGLLIRVRDLGLTLLELVRTEPDWSRLYQI
ncbi:MAG TPA: ATP-binding cassette domain-containing protein [Symbiobacteriaceae bacterium]|jgi:energy-coupling factor transporter ATP-binding protein EcfA2|nr:ATP-binding cassette domain-containing protein [Symbiobacteriaceae bacterium]